MQIFSLILAKNFSVGYIPRMDKERAKVIALYLRAQKHAAKSGLVKVCGRLIAKRVGVNDAFVSRTIAKYKEEATRNGGK